jgi:mono/diheme cytochrome c family protein
MRRRLTLFLACSVVTPVLVASAQVRVRNADWVAPPAEAARVNPLAQHAGAEAGGRKLFQQRCTTCHGEQGRGTTKGPDLTQGDVQAQSDGSLFWKISGGNAHQGMPSFSFLPEPQRWQLVLHVRTLVN